MDAHTWTQTLRVDEGFRLADLDPDAKPGYDQGKARGVADLAARLADLNVLQERLFAESRAGVAKDAVLLVLQAMDSAGKGGIVRHVVGGVDPQGVALAAFKAPTAEEREHDFLWRIEKRLPDPGFIGVFDRSHYEDVLIGRVRELAPPAEIERRYDAINEFEARVAASGTRIVKVMLHISPEEQKTRLMERLDRPDKHWKYNPGDVDERLVWPQYMQAYQTVFDRTSTAVAPWHVIPANAKWYARLAVQELLLAALEDIDPSGRAPTSTSSPRRSAWPPAERRSLRSGQGVDQGAELHARLEQFALRIGSGDDPGARVGRDPDLVLAHGELGAAQGDRPLAVARGIHPAHRSRVATPVERLELADRGDGRGGRCAGDGGGGVEHPHQVERRLAVAQFALDVGRQVEQVRQLQQEGLFARGQRPRVGPQRGEHALHGVLMLVEVLGAGGEVCGSGGVGIRVGAAADRAGQHPRGHGSLVAR